MFTVSFIMVFQTEHFFLKQTLVKEGNHYGTIDSYATYFFQSIKYQQKLVVRACNLHKCGKKAC